MKVICVTPTQSLVTGCIYEVSQIHVDSIQVFLKKDLLSSFVIKKHFTKLDGSMIDSVHRYRSEKYLEYISDRSSRILRNDLTKLKVGDYVIPTKDTFKSLIHRKSYRITDIKITPKPYSATKIKIEGISRWYKIYSFTICPPEVSRAYNIDLITGSENNEVITIKDPKEKKINYLKNDEKILVLIDLLFRSKMDKNRNNLDIIDWAIKKRNNPYRLKREDFDQVLGLDLKQIVEIIGIPK